MKPAWSVGARSGPMREYGQLRIFACEGLICIVDERPGKEEGKHTMVTPAEIEERVKALNIPYRGQGRIDVPKAQRQRFDERLRGSQNCMECIKEAKAMGDPSDPAVQAYWRRHKSNSTVVVKFSAGSDPAGYPALPPLKLGPLTGRDAAADVNLTDTITAAVGGAASTMLHRLPQKKNRSGIVLLND